MEDCGVPCPDQLDCRRQLNTDPCVANGCDETAIASAEPCGVEPVRRLSRQVRRSAVHAEKADPQVDPYRRAAHRRRPEALARAVRARWGPLLAGAVLTVAGVIWLDGPGGLVLLPGLWLLLSAPLIPAGPKADRMRRPEVELERAVFSHPAQRRLAIQAMAAHDKRFPVTGRC